MAGRSLNQPVVGMAADDATGGYWLVASDGGIFAFHATFFGSTGTLTLNQPIVGMEAASSGSGYRFVAADGGVFSFHLPFKGSLPAMGVTGSGVVGIASSGSTNAYTGYWIVDRSGTVTAFGNATPGLTPTS